MSNKAFILAIDQGTSSTKTLFVNERGEAVAKGTAPLQTHYIDRGFVEQEPEAIWQNVLDAVRDGLQQFEAEGHDPAAIRSIGISNQRESFVVWDRQGKPLHNAVVWQCKRSISICTEMIESGLSDKVRKKTGLVIDPYFSATKLIWLVRHVPEINAALSRKELYFGTVDTWLLYKMTSGKVYATDHTNASRTMLFNLTTLCWDEELLHLFGLEGLLLPEIRSSAASYGATSLDGLLPEYVSVSAMIGDSHAAAFGEGCYSPGEAKATLGTGCSILMNVGNQPISSAQGMVSTICWSKGDRVDYALEGVMVSCGSTIEWLKNELGLFTESQDTEAMALSVSDSDGVVLIPAFSGLGSPYWQMERKASISGLHFGTGKNHLVRAALESIAFQLADIMQAMSNDASVTLSQLNLDGGMTANRFLMQAIADVLHQPVQRVDMPDVSALGAAYLAGWESGLYDGCESFRKKRGEENAYVPKDNGVMDRAYAEWRKVIGYS